MLSLEEVEEAVSVLIADESEVLSSYRNSCTHFQIPQDPTAETIYQCKKQILEKLIKLLRLSKQQIKK